MYLNMDWATPYGNSKFKIPYGRLKLQNLKLQSASKNLAPIQRVTCIFLCFGHQSLVSNYYPLLIAIHNKHDVDENSQTYAESHLLNFELVLVVSLLIAVSKV